MSSDLNSRSDAKLKRLDILVIRDVVTMCFTKDVTQADVVAWLKKEHGVSSSTSALSQALPYLIARVKSWEREQKVQAWLECEKLEHPEITDEELYRRGQRKFSLMSIADEDPDAWAKIRKIETDRESAQLNRQKFQRETVELFIKWAQDKKAMELANSNSPHPVKMEALGQQMFGDLW